jgi:hypothetical protein
MAPTRRQVLLVPILPLVAAIGVTWLLDFHSAVTAVTPSADGAPATATRESDEAVELLATHNLLADSAALAPLDLALPPRTLSAGALASGRLDGGGLEQPLPIPEPHSGLLLALGLAGVATRRRSRARLGA